MTPPDDAFGRFLCQVNAWRRAESRWKSISAASVAFGMLMLVVAGMQCAVACKTLSWLDQSTAKSAQVQEEMQLLQNELDQSRKLLEAARNPDSWYKKMVKEFEEWEDTAAMRALTPDEFERLLNLRTSNEKPE